MITTKLATAAISALVLPVALAMSAPSAQASEPSTDSTSVNSRVEQDVQALLRLNPGSHRIAINEVEVDEGVTISVPLQTNSLLGCATYLLCLNENADFGGEKLNFKKCKNENLIDIQAAHRHLGQPPASACRRGGRTRHRTSTVLSR